MSSLKFNPKFTKGTWVIDGSVKSAINSGAKHIAMINCYNGGPNNPGSFSLEEHNANVHLISTAPEMYKILELLEKIDNLSNCSEEEATNELLNCISELSTLYPEVLKRARGLEFIGDKQ